MKTINTHDITNSLTNKRIASSAESDNLISRIQDERISIYWEYEGGCHIERYGGESEPLDTAYGYTILEALRKIGDFEPTEAKQLTITSSID